VCMQFTLASRLVWKLSGGKPLHRPGRILLSTSCLELGGGCMLSPFNTDRRSEFGGILELCGVLQVSVVPLQLQQIHANLQDISSFSPISHQTHSEPLKHLKHYGSQPAIKHPSKTCKLILVVSTYQ